MSGQAGQAWQVLIGQDAVVDTLGPCMAMPQAMPQSLPQSLQLIGRLGSSYVIILKDPEKQSFGQVLNRFVL